MDSTIAPSPRASAPRVPILGTSSSSSIIGVSSRVMGVLQAFSIPRVCELTALGLNALIQPKRLESVDLGLYKASMDSTRSCGYVGEAGGVGGWVWCGGGLEHERILLLCVFPVGRGMSDLGIEEKI